MSMCLRQKKERGSEMESKRKRVCDRDHKRETVLACVLEREK
jgi:hypothetical protein